MICQDFIPSPPLREYIKNYHLRHFVFSDGTCLPFKPYAPRPEQTLAFYPRGYEFVEFVATHKFIKRSRSFVMGQYVERTNRHLGTADFMVFLIEFQPGVLYRITGIPFYELTNTDIDAEAIFSNQIRLVNERLNSTDNYEEMIQIVEQFLLRLVTNIKRDAHPLDTVANLIVTQPQNTQLVRLASEAFLCTRQFERKFKERQGISPKLFSRIARLNKAIRIKYNHPNEDWLSVALDCGYHDYQHLVKDFQDFTSATPNSYFLEDNKAPETFFGLRDSSLL
jgi:AraC-like DNA-binding protein